MVDPPLNAKEILQREGVSSRLIDFVIVSHCHADHDSGTMQMILGESQLTLVTTPLIMVLYHYYSSKNSFIRKYTALTALRESEFRRLFSFKPAIVGDFVNIYGAEFRFFYSIHTIPCIGFE